ncbi:MAG TPA: hypothetical protein DD811_04100, partial [Syntrophomonas sp.]|nr:hypothetical protein [Syntrophomonas sp.]
MVEEGIIRGLGNTNWHRFVNNLGINNVPENPWEYPGAFNFVGALWKGAWRTLQREKSKSEYQARQLEAQYEYEEKK